MQNLTMSDASSRGASSIFSGHLARYRQGSTLLGDIAEDQSPALLGQSVQYRIPLPGDVAGGDVANKHLLGTPRSRSDF